MDYQSYLPKLAQVILTTPLVTGHDRSPSDLLVCLLKYQPVLHGGSLRVLDLYFSFAFSRVDALLHLFPRVLLSSAWRHFFLVV